MKYEIAFLSIAKEFARAKIGFVSPAGFVAPNVYKFEYRNTSFGLTAANTSIA
jgi:hypothetical protein